MKRFLFLAGTTAFWLVMTILLVYREFFTLSMVQAPYEVLPIHDMLFREEYRGIYLGEKLIGFTFSVLERQEKEKEEEKDTYELRQSTYMTFLFLGQEREMMVISKALVNERLELMSFELKITSGEYWTEMKGRIRDRELEVFIENPQGKPIRQVFAVNPPVFFSESLYMLWTPENIRPGRQGRLQIWNPLIMSFEEIEFRVGRKEMIVHQGEEREVYPVLMTEQGIETRYWITEDGIVLKNESPTGLTLIKQEAWKLFDTLRENRHSLTDLPNLYSIAAGADLENPEDISSLTVKVSSGGEEQIKTLAKAGLDKKRNVPLPVPPGGWTAEDLASTEFIQADDPRIRKKAQEIIQGETNALQAALKIMNWAHAYVTPTPTVSIPSAVQVLEIRKGDCNEYTALFTALARSAGIPTRMTAGLVYQNGRFFYHAWPEVYLDGWVGMDPTFGQAPVYATHIPLVRGDLKEQVDLIKRLGKISLHILEVTR